MFEELGLNIARAAPTTAPTRGPTTARAGSTARRPTRSASTSPRAAAPALEVTLWDPSAQLRYRKKSSVPPRPDGAPNRGLPLGRVDRSHMLDLQDRLDELKELGLYRRMRMVSGPQGPRVVLDGKPVLLLCSNNYLGLADHPRVREAAADAAMRWGVGAGASRLVSGNMTLHRRLEERLAAFKGTQSALLFGSGYLANLGVVPGAGARAARSCSPTSSTTRRSSTAAGSPARRRSSTATPTSSTSPGACATRTAAAR